MQQVSVSVQLLDFNPDNLLKQIIKTSLSVVILKQGTSFSEVTEHPIFFKLQ